MVLGHTYFLESIKELVIPLRKTIRDPKSGRKVVVATGIVLNPHNRFVRNFTSEHITFLLRDIDRYIQYYNFDPRYYERPLPQKDVSEVIRKMEESTGLRIERIKKQKRVVTTVYTDSVSEKSALISCMYIDRYDLWVVSAIPTEIVASKFFKEETVIFVIYLAIMIFIYFLIDTIDKQENKQRETLRKQALRDSLTGLRNRYFIDEYIRHAKKPYTLLFIDLDRFKTINDGFGHDYGDKVLKIAALRLRTIAKRYDAEVVRYSGDEFFLITDSLKIDTVERIAKEILATITQEFVIDEYRFILGASIGISFYPKDGKNFDEVKRYADLAMYEAKRRRNSFVLFHKKLKEHYLKQDRIERLLKEGIKDGEFSVVYQPQVSSDGNIYGVEALVRWKNKELGFVSPEEFIPIAEATGLIKEIGRFVMQQAVEDTHEVIERTRKRYRLSVNVSAKQFLEYDFLECFSKKMEHLPFPKAYFTLEITESVFIEEQKKVISMLHTLKEQGIHISLDDFGTGYSSMSMLRNLPIDELKIDKTFIDHITDEKNARQIVHSILIIAKSLGLKVIAEGVETMEQKTILDEFACDLYQGYLFSKPLTKEQLVEALKRNEGVFSPTC